MKKIILAISLTFLSFITFQFFPTVGLYLICISTSIIFGLFFSIKRPTKIFFSIIVFFLAWVSLVDKAFEEQGQIIVGEIIDYQNKYDSTPLNLDYNYTLKINSFTPIFSKYSYDRKYDSLRYFFCNVSYTDIWGNNKIYCDADGEFENKSPVTTIK